MKIEEKIRKIKEMKMKHFSLPEYCCGKCKNFAESRKNLKIVNNTGYTHNLLCTKLNKVVWGL